MSVAAANVAMSAIGVWFATASRSVVESYSAVSLPFTSAIPTAPFRDRLPWVPMFQPLSSSFWSTEIEKSRMLPAAFPPDPSAVPVGTTTVPPMTSDAPTNENSSWDAG